MSVKYNLVSNNLLLNFCFRSASTYKLKKRVYLSELWLSSCTEEVSDIIFPPGRTFVIGWPTENFVALFK